MKKRRAARGLSSSDADHGQRGEVAAQRVRQSAHRVYDSTETGDCAAALRYLLAASHDAGEAIAHSKAGGSIPSLTMAQDDVIGVRGIFERKCQFKKVRR